MTDPKRNIEVHVTVHSSTTVNVVAADKPASIIQRLKEWFKKK